MPASSDIYGQIQPIQQPNALAQMAQALQVKGLQQEQGLNALKADAYSRDQTRRNKLLELAGGWNGATTDDQRISGLKNSGFFDEADKLEAANQKRLEVKSTGQKNTSDALSKYVTMQGDIATRVMANPTPQFAALALDAMEGHAKALGFDQMVPQIAAERQLIANMTPDQLKQWAAGHALKAEKLLPTIQTRNTGGTTDTLAINPLTGVGQVTGSVQNTMTPGEVSVRQTAANRLAFDEKQAGGVEYKTDGDGNLVAVPKKPGAGPIVGMPVIGSDGKPLAGGGKALTEGQAKANLFGTRMQESDKILSSMAKAGVLQPGAIKGMAESLGNIAGLGTESMGGALSDAAGSLTNFTQSSEQQQVEQAQRDFINADLRRESGASISPAEFRNGQKQYFPQRGDSDEVLAQKARNRQLATQGILAEVPENRRAKTPTAKTEASPTFDADKERRYQEWKARQGK